jgi:hypothetical protein
VKLAVPSLPSVSRALDIGSAARAHAFAPPGPRRNKAHVSSAPAATATASATLIGHRSGRQSSSRRVRSWCDRSTVQLEANYCIFTYSVLASFRMRTSGSAVRRGTASYCDFRCADIYFTESRMRTTSSSRLWVSSSRTRFRSARASAE